jgi:flagellar hook-length control protein FliK
MLYTSHLNASHAPGRSSNGPALSADSEPETKELDFFKALLGLKVMDGEESPETKLFSSASPLGKSPLQNAGGAEDPLLSVLERKERTAWNLIFPGLSPTALPNANAIAAKGQKPAGETETGNDFILRRWETVKTSSDLPLKSPKQIESKTPGISPEMADITGVKMDNAQNADLKNSVVAKHVASTRENGLNQLSIAQSPESNQQVAIQKYAKAISDAKGSKNSQIEGNRPLTAKPSGEKVANVAEASRTENVKQVKPVKSGEEDTVKLADAGNKKSRGLSKTEVASSDVTGLQVKDLKAPTTGTSVAAKSQHSTVSVQDLSNKVESMARQGGGKMTVSLNPPHLGSLELKVTTKGKNVEVEMLSSSSEAKSILQSKLQDLKSSLHSQDLHLTKIEVNVARDVNSKPETAFTQDMNSQGQSFQSESQAWRDSQQPRSQGLFDSRQVTVASNATAPSRVQSQHTGNVDLRI